MDDALVVKAEDLKPGMVVMDGCYDEEGINGPFLITQDSKENLLLMDFDYFFSRSPATACWYLLIDSELILDENYTKTIKSNPSLGTIVYLVFPDGSKSEKYYLLSSQGTGRRYDFDRCYLTDLDTFITYVPSELGIESISHFINVSTINWHKENEKLCLKRWEEFRQEYNSGGKVGFYKPILQYVVYPE